MAVSRIINNEFIGQQFGRLLITGVEIIKRNGKSNSIATAVCECGNTKQYFLSSIKSGATKSCGCLNMEKSSNSRRYINIIHGFSRHPLYIVWRGILRRCYSESHKHYKSYGGRGVKVCDEWRNDFMTFYNWALANGWQKGLQIDKDIKGDGKLYSPETCVFVTNTVNGRKKRNSVLIGYNGETKALSEWCELLGMKYTTIRRRLRLGMKPDEAFSKVKYA
jgi:hypothetical protein